MKNLLKKFLASITVTSTLFMLAMATAPKAHADTKFTIKLPQPLVATSNSPFPGVFTNIFNYVFGITFTLAVLALIVSGIRYIASYGNDAYMKKAKNNLFYAILGLVIVILAYTITLTISAIFS